MIMLSKRDKETLREISQWKEFYGNWKRKDPRQTGTHEYCR